jgi:hypothetical protein
MEGDKRNTRREKGEGELKDEREIMIIEGRGDRREEERIREGRNVGEK